MLLLIPSYSIEDFSVDRVDTEANQILSAWSALYHPALLERAGGLPSYANASNPPEVVDAELIVIPPCCEHLVPENWLLEKSETHKIIRHESDRETIIAEALKAIQLEEHGFDKPFVETFLAVGTHYVLSELLTRQLRYMSMLDEYKLKENTLEAIKCRREENFDKSEDFLRQIFEQLQQSREYFYPMQAYFLELLLTAPTTLGEKLRETLNENIPQSSDDAKAVNLVLTISQLKQMTAEHRETLEAVQLAAAESRLELVGDPLESVPIAMLAASDLVERLMRGTEYYHDMIGVRPVAFMREQPEFLAVLPSFLSRAGYQGALLYTTDGWQIAEKRHSMFRWESPDGRKINTITRYPNDANSNETFLQLPQGLGRMLEGDNVPTVTLAHYPKYMRRWLNDLKIAHRYAQVFGQFFSLSGYFKASQYSGLTKQLDESLFAKSKQLARASEQKLSNPVSMWSEYHQITQRCQELITLATLTACVAGKKIGADDESLKLWNAIRTFLARADQFRRRYYRQLFNDSLLPKETSEEESWEDFEKFSTKWDCVFAEIKRTFTKFLTGMTTKQWNEMITKLDEDSSMPENWGYLFINPLVTARKFLHDKTYLEIPPMGYTWVPNSSTEQEATAKETSVPKSPMKKLLSGLFGGKPKVPQMAEHIENEGYYLRNEFFEMRVDETTGVVASLFYYNQRGNRLAQQVAFRFPEEIRKTDTRPSTDGNVGYSIMATDKIESFADSTRASLLIKGRLMHFDGSKIATFEERITVTRGSKTVRFHIKIDPITNPVGNAWDVYFAARFAWENVAYEPFVGIVSGRHACLTKFVEAPYFFDVRDETQSLTILANGLPFHRRTSDTRVDTILITENERQQTFSIDVVLDADCPFVRSMEQLTPMQPLIIRSPKPKNPTAWLFTHDTKNVVLMRCEPLFDEMPIAQKETQTTQNTESESQNAPQETISPKTTPEETKNRIENGWRFPNLADLLPDLETLNNENADPHQSRQLTGLRLYFLETEGRRVKTTFRSFRPIRQARTLDFEFNEEKKLDAMGDQASFSIGSHEFLLMEIRF
ncbi:MAG: hypothetical protein LBJ67_02615 [Planctomycetaceae bacterium]|jgi:alpha-mannosidase|nr:hypothetical protein [Planctomycetaceae bacterium]